MSNLRRCAALLILLLAGCVAPAATVTDAALACPPPCVLVIEEGPAYAWEPTVAADPTEPSTLLAASVSMSRLMQAGSPRQVWIEIHTSRDGGETWATAPFPGGAGSARAGDSHAAHTFLADPVVAFGPDGTAFLAYLADTTVGGAGARVFSGLHFFVARSPDGGLSWETPVQVAAGAGWAARAGAPGAAPASPATPDWEGHDKPSLAVAPDGTLVAAWSWIRGPEWDCKIVVSVSGDGGRTWSPFDVVDGSGPCFSGTSVAFHGSDWHIAYVEFGGPSLHLATSRDKGGTWDVRRVGDAAAPPILRAQPGAVDGPLWLASAHDPRGDGVQLPQLRWSDDGGTSWKGPLDLDAPAREGAALVALDVAADGTAYVAWLSHAEREGAVVADLHAQMFRSDAMSGSAVVAHASIAATGDMIGDYFGLAALPDGAIAVYGAPDETGDLDVVAARLLRA